MYSLILFSIVKRIFLRSVKVYQVPTQLLILGTYGSKNNGSMNLLFCISFYAIYSLSMTSLV